MYTYKYAFCFNLNFLVANYLPISDLFICIADDFQAVVTV
jgi:hypothetical protein